MPNFKDVRAKFLPDLGQKWQKKLIIFNNFTLSSQSESPKICNDIISAFLN